MLTWVKKKIYRPIDTFLRQKLLTRKFAKPEKHKFQFGAQNLYHLNNLNEKEKFTSRRWADRNIFFWNVLLWNLFERRGSYLCLDAEFGTSSEMVWSWFSQTKSTKLIEQYRPLAQLLNYMYTFFQRTFFVWRLFF